MNRPTAGLRLGVILLFVLGLLSPVASIGAGAQAFDCEDLTATQAQALLDADADLAEDLDPDGDGEACNHDEGTTSTDDDRASSDGDYVAAVQDELDYLGGTFDRFLELNDEAAATSDEDELADIVDEANAIAAEWVEYPDVAADLEAPSEFADLEDAYLDLADLVGESGELWEEYWAIPAGDPDEDAALEAFNDVFIDAQDQLAEVQVFVDDAGSSTGTTDDPVDDPVSGGDADEYLGAVQDEIDSIGDDAADLMAILEVQADDPSEVTQDDIDFFNDTMEAWSTYPDDVAAELVAPEGLEDVEDAYLDLADTAAESSLLWDDYLGTDAGSVEEEDAFDALVDGIDTIQSEVADVQDLIDEAGGSTGTTTDDPTEEPSNGGDADAYLADVSDTADAWIESIDRFNELLQGDFTDADIDELSEILVAWIGAPEVAAELDVPEGMEDVQAAFEDLADTMSDMGINFTSYLGTDADSPESEEALDAFGESMTQALDDYDVLQDELDAVS